MKILITGAKGMLGTDLAEVLTQQGFNVVATDIDTLDVTDNDAIAAFLNNDRYNLVIHTAGYTNVDNAETDREATFLANYKATEYLAINTAKFNIPIIYISTDYVFDGKKRVPYEPEDVPNPINIYGISKFKGEETIKKYNKNHYIIRTSWLYGNNGKNFVETIINLASEKPELRVVNDQIGCPTWTVDLSNAIVNLLNNQKPYGTYHICGSEHTSWHGFAAKIVELMELNTKVIPVSTDEFPRPAKRPKYSVMNNENTCPDWKHSLEKYIKLRKK